MPAETTAFGDDQSTNTSVRPRPLAWYALGVLIVAVIFGFIDRQIIVLVVEPMKRDLGLTDFEIGAINGLGPALFAVIAGYPLAWLADRVDRRWLLIACILFWSAATAARGFAGSFGHLLTFTIAIAVGEAVLTPITYSLIPDLFSGRRRELANFIFFGAIVVGVGFGLMLGGAALGAVESLRPLLPEGMQQLAGWRLAFLLVAAPGVLVALAVLPIPSARPSIVTAKQPTANASNSLLRYLGRHRRTVALIYSAAGLYAFGYGVILTWLPVAIIRDLGASAEEVGVRYGLAFTISAGLGIGLAMATASFWRRVAGEAHIIRALWVMMALGVVPIVALAFAASPTQAYIFSGLAFFLVMSGTAFSPSMLQNLAPPLLRARIAATVMVLYAAIGATGPMVAGILSDSLGAGPGTLMAIIAGLAAVALAGAALLYRLAEKPFVRTVHELTGGESATPIT